MVRRSARVLRMQGRENAAEKKQTTLTLTDINFEQVRGSSRVEVGVTVWHWGLWWTRAGTGSTKSDAHIWLRREASTHPNKRFVSFLSSTSTAF